MGGFPTSRRVRLQRRPPELREGMVCAEEELVLRQVREGLPRIWEREHDSGCRQWIWCWGTERPRRGPSRTSTLGHQVSSPGTPEWEPTSQTFFNSVESGTRGWLLHWRACAIFRCTASHNRRSRDLRE